MRLRSQPSDHTSRFRLDVMVTRTSPTAVLIEVPALRREIVTGWKEAIKR